MDDVDATQAQIARNMLQSGDWVTPRLDGVAYLEKPPLKYWMIAVSFMIFGAHDWAARIPIALSAVLLCWLTARFGKWAFGQRGGQYAGIVLATSVGLFLFTRVLISDVVLTLAITSAFWGLLRALGPDEEHRTFWALLMWASMGIGLLVKGLIAAVFPIGAGLVFLSITGRLFQRGTWKLLRPALGIATLLAIAAPWHVLAILRNPPHFDFSLHAEKGAYHGFFWFYFINEHLLRFLNLRYPRDYDTVPRLYFWLYHLLWLFPWSVYAPAAFRLSYRGSGRAAQTRLLALCWTGFILAFFSFSTTQEYYSMPCYPALALILGSAISSGDRALRLGTRAIALIATAAALAAAAILWTVRGLPTPKDIAAALNQNPEIYTLSLGHMTDLTLGAFAYLRLPLAVAAVAFAVGAFGAWRHRARSPKSSEMAAAVPLGSLALMMVLFFHAARLALVVFDPYMSSRPLAQALAAAPPGKLIVDDQYYAFSSVFFYANRGALLLNGRVNNLEYGSYAPDAPRNVFIDDREFQEAWRQKERYYLLAEGPTLARFEKLAGKAALHEVAESGGKFLFTNQ
jgi:4-amino-4-deoxy-L-arabinose transferase-like glycosyltransferase